MMKNMGEKSTDHKVLTKINKYTMTPKCEVISCAVKIPGTNSVFISTESLCFIYFIVLKISVFIMSNAYFVVFFFCFVVSQIPVTLHLMQL